MKSYQDDVRRRVLALRGIVDESVLEAADNKTSLDAAIATFVGRVLSTQELMVFMALFCCRASWEEVWDMYNEASGTTVSLGAVKRSARRAIEKIKRDAGNAPELGGWTPKWDHQPSTGTLSQH